MRARRLNIGIRSGAERSKALREAVRRVARGDRTAQEPGLYFESVEELRPIVIGVTVADNFRPVNSG